MSTVWLNDLSSANLLRKTYISGFLDISGGDMNLRSGNFFTGGTITQNTDSANVDVPSYSMFSVTDLSYMFASITQPMTTFAQDITTNGNTVVKQNLFVINDASLNSRLFLGGDASLNSRLFLGGDASLNSRLFLRGDALLNSKLVLVGDASLNSKLLVAGDASLNSKLSVTGDVSLNSKLTVAGDASLNSKLTVTGDALLNSKLTVAGDASLNGNFRLRNNCVFYSNNLLIKSPTPNTHDNCFLNITSSTDTGGSAQNIVLGVSGALFNRQAIINTYRDGVSAFVPLSLQVDSVEKIRIESTKTILTGNVGIATSNPTVALDVSGGALVSGNVGIGKTTANAVLDVSGGVLVSGNVAIGKTTAAVALDVSGSVSIGGNVVMVPRFSGVNTVTPNTIDASGNNTWTKNGIGWRSSQSSVYLSSTDGCYAFDTILAGSSRYVSAGDSVGTARYTTTAGASFGNATTNAAITSVSINGGVSENIRGEYLQISASAKLKITQFTLATSNDFNTFPRSYYLVGSNDGSTWTSIQRGESSLTSFTLANNTTIANPIPIGLPSTTATVTYPGSTNPNALTVTNHNGASDYYSMFRFIATATISPTTADPGLELGEWTPTFTLQSDTLTLSSNTSTTNNMGLNVDGLVSCTRGYQLSYTTLPTYTNTQIGFLISNTLSGVTINNTLTTISTINLTIGVYIITFNIGNGVWTGTIYCEASIYDAAGTELCKSAETGVSGSSYAACVGTLIYSATATTSLTLRTKLTSGTNNMTAAKGVFQAIRIA